MQVERRYHPRYSLVCLVQLRLQLDNEVMELSGHAVNLSQSGVQLTCDQYVLDTLLGQNMHPVVCEIHILLPSKKEIVIEESRLVVNRRLSQDVYHLGFNFVEIAESDNHLLTGFIEQLKQQQLLEQKDKQPKEE